MFGNRTIHLEKFSILLISIVIVAFLFIQAGETFRLFCPWKCAPTFWPFMDYPMYGQVHYAGTKIDQISLIGILPDSTEVDINYQDFGLDSAFKIDLVSQALQAHDLAQLKAYFEAYNATHTTPLVGLRLENKPLVLTKTGAVPGQPEIWADFRAEAFEEFE